jgi:hypothetical protein
MQKYVLCLLLLGLVSVACAESARPRLLALDFEIVDTSGEPVDKRAEHARRLSLVRAWIAKELAARKLYVDVDAATIRTQIDAVLRGQYLRSCNGCELDLAQAAGADAVLLGKFNKVSTLIGSLDLVIKDAKTGARLVERRLDFRGDTDEAWLRAARFFVDELARDAAKPAY